MVGDRDFVSVSSEIVDRLLRPAEGSFAVDNPVPLAGRCDVLFELAMEAQFGLLELGEEEPAEESGVLPPRVTTQWMCG